MESICEACGYVFAWKWEDAFAPHLTSCHKSETWHVKTVLFNAGYGMEIDQYMTTPYISVVYDKAGRPLCEETCSSDPAEQPRDWLPPEIVELLDRAFPETASNVLHNSDNERSQTMTKSRTTGKAKEEAPDTAAEESQDRRPDYLAIQYRQVRSTDGIKTRREQLGVAWTKAGGGFVFRPHGMQVIQNDVHFFPNGDQPPSLANE